MSRPVWTHQPSSKKRFEFFTFIILWGTCNPDYMQHSLCWNIKKNVPAFLSGRGRRRSKHRTAWCSCSLFMCCIVFPCPGFTSLCFAISFSDAVRKIVTPLGSQLVAMCLQLCESQKMVNQISNVRNPTAAPNSPHNKWCTTNDAQQSWDYKMSHVSQKNRLKLNSASQSNINVIPEDTGPSHFSGGIRSASWLWSNCTADTLHDFWSQNLNDILTLVMARHTFKGWNLSAVTTRPSQPNLANLFWMPQRGLLSSASYFPAVSVSVFNWHIFVFVTHAWFEKALTALEPSESECLCFIITYIPVGVKMERRVFWSKIKSTE